MLIYGCMLSVYNCYSLPAMSDELKNDSTTWALLFCSWLIAATSTLGSLFFSEVMGLVPCVLCWYQRIFMFPLAIILLVGLYPLDRAVIRFALPIVFIGVLFTLYHCLLFYGLIPESMQPCQQGISCKDASMMLFDVVPIPLLSLASFLTITVLLLVTRARMKS